MCYFLGKKFKLNLRDTNVTLRNVTLRSQQRRHFSLLVKKLINNSQKNRRGKFKLKNQKFSLNISTWNFCAMVPKKFRRTLPDKSLQICPHPSVINIPAQFTAPHHRQSMRTTRLKKKKTFILLKRPFKFGMKRRQELRDFRTTNMSNTFKLGYMPTTDVILTID